MSALVKSTNISQANIYKTKFIHIKLLKSPTSLNDLYELWGSEEPNKKKLLKMCIFRPVFSPKYTTNK